MPHERTGCGCANRHLAGVNRSVEKSTSALGCPKTALVFSLQSGQRKSLGYINLLQPLDHLAALKAQRREPVEGNEILLN